jgi:hypothetical protein
MANLEDAKAAVLEQFKTSMPPGIPEPTQFTLPDMLTLPILTVGTLNNGAYRVITGTFVPGSDSKADSWSTADQFTTRYLNMIQNMAYGFSTKDANEILKLTNENQDVLNSLVKTWEKTYSRITDTQLADAKVNDKVTYVIAQFTPEFMKSFNWSKFAPDYNRAKAAIDILSNLNSAQVTFGNQLVGIKNNIQTPSAVNGGMQAFDNNNNKVWVPGFNVDENFPSKLANGSTVKIEIDLMDIATESSSFSINGKAGGSFKAWFLRIGGSVSAEYNESNFKQLMSKVKVKLEYKPVAYLTTSPINLTTNGAIGWYASELLKQAYKRGPNDTGPYFVSDAENQKKLLESGGLQSVRGFLVSPMPSGTMQFAFDDYSSFQKYFHTEAHADASLFGFIPIASVNTSYTKSSSGATDKGYAMEVQINNNNDANNLVVHGAVLENPLS